MPTKVCLVKAMVFPVVMYGCESWTIKKAEHWRTDAFELLCWRRFLRVPWTARRSNQSILKEISPECSLEGRMLKLKLQYFGHLSKEVTHLKRPWCWERLKAGGEWEERRWDGWMASLSQWTWVWASSRRWWWTGRPESMGSHRVRHVWATELTDCSARNWELLCYLTPTSPAWSREQGELWDLGPPPSASGRSVICGWGPWLLCRLAVLLHIPPSLKKLNSWAQPYLRSKEKKRVIQQLGYITIHDTSGFIFSRFCCILIIRKIHDHYTILFEIL